MIPFSSSKTDILSSVVSSRKYIFPCSLNLSIIAFNSSEIIVYSPVYIFSKLLGASSNPHKKGSSFTSIPLHATTQNGRVDGLVVSPFRFPKIIPKCLTSNPLSQIATSNPRLQPDTHFAVDMFPYKKTELFQKSGFKSKPPKKPGNTPLSGTYLSFLDIKTTVSTWHNTTA